MKPGQLQLKTLKKKFDLAGLLSGPRVPAPVRTVFTIVKYTFLEFFDDNCTSVAAAIAYFTFQSLFPLVLVIILIGTFFLNSQSAVRQQLIKGIENGLPQASGLDIGSIINNVAHSAPGLLSVTALFLLWSGTNIFDQLIFGINAAYDVERDTRSFGVKLALRFGFFLVMGFLIGLGYAFSTILELTFRLNINIWGLTPRDFNFLVPFGLSLIPFFLMFAIFTVLYKFAPDRKGVRWRDVLVGALVAALLFELLKRGFTLYITLFDTKASYTRTYGFLAGVLIFMLYLWLNAVIMLLGAEVASVMGGWKSVDKKSRPQDDTPLTAGQAHNLADRILKGDVEELERSQKAKKRHLRAISQKRNLVAYRRPNFQRRQNP